MLSGAIFAFLAPACYARNLDIDVTSSVTMAYDDNITYSSNDRLGDFVTSLEAGLVLMQKGETHQLSLQTDIIEEIFADHGNFDNTAEDLKFDYKQDFSEHDHLELKENLTHSYEPTSFDDAFGRTTGRYSTLDNQAGLSYTHDLTEQLSAEAHYDNTVDAYSHNGPINSILHQAGTKVNYTWDSANIFDVSYDYFRRLFQNGPGATVNSLLTGVRHYFTAQFYTDIGAGGDFISNFDGKNSIEPHYAGALTDQVDKNDQVSLTFEKKDSTDDYSEVLFNSWRTAFNFDRQISQKLNTTLNVFYGQGHYSDSMISEKFTGVQAQLNYAINPKAKLGVGYSYSDSDSNNGGLSYRKNYYYLNVTIQF
jgi:hypothetical protein